jgi:hypothetical protein
LLTVDGGPVLALYTSLIADLLRSEIQAGHATTGDPYRVAEVIARLAISLVLTRDGAICLDDPALDACTRDDRAASRPAATRGVTPWFRSCERAVEVHRGVAKEV